MTPQQTIVITGEDYGGSAREQPELRVQAPVRVAKTMRKKTSNAIKKKYSKIKNTLPEQPAAYATKSGRVRKAPNKDIVERMGSNIGVVQLKAQVVETRTHAVVRKLPTPAAYKKTKKKVSGDYLKYDDGEVEDNYR